MRSARPAASRTAERTATSGASFVHTLTRPRNPGGPSVARLASTSAIPARRSRTSTRFSAKPAGGPPAGASFRGATRAVETTRTGPTSATSIPDALRRRRGLVQGPAVISRLTRPATLVDHEAARAEVASAWNYVGEVHVAEAQGEGRGPVLAVGSGP
jgi:hypothetical protein